MKISDLPRGLKELALMRQLECIDDEFDHGSDDLPEGFSWEKTPEGDKFWDAVDDGIFTAFYNCSVVKIKPKTK